MKHFYIVLCMAIFLGFPLITYAQCYTDTENPCYDLWDYGNETNIDFTNSLTLCCFLGSVATILVAVAAGLAILIVIVGGIMYMTAGADESRVTNAKKTLMYGLIGAAIVFLASFLIQLLKEIVVDRLTG